MHILKQTELYFYTKKSARQLVINIQISLVHPYSTSIICQIVSLLGDEKPKYLLCMVQDLSSVSGTNTEEKMIQFFITNKETNRIEIIEKIVKENQTFNQLTKKETKINDLIGRGFKTREIAINMGLKIETIRTHRRNIRRKKSETYAGN